ncbi:hypothetical protein LSAT2_012993 [Lamellibrachia satsuma]|nr:hypothetical protein LSAT2_012993 [Lamellibrachia satsuma]
MSYIVSTLFFSLRAGDSISAQTVKGSCHALLGSELCSSTGCRRAPTVGSRDASVSIRPGVFRLDSVIHSVGSTDENIAPDGTTTLHNKRLLWKTTCERRELCAATSLQRFRLINCDHVGGAGTIETGYQSLRANHNIDATMNATQPFGAVMLATLLLFLTPSARTDTCPVADVQCEMNMNCELPHCNCASESPPDDLAPADVPQLVVFAFSGPLNKDSWHQLRRIFDNNGKGGKKRVNPNGERITMTLFVSDVGTDDYCRAGEFYNHGHEIGVTGFKETNSMENLTPMGWQEVMMGQRENLKKEANIDEDDIHGMRAPALEAGGDKQFMGIQLMNERKWLPYDSSIMFVETALQLWPYTMNFRFTDTIGRQNHYPGACYPGVWEVPVQRFCDNYNTEYDFIDEWVAATNFEMLYYTIANNFWRHYSTNRAPFIINAHTDWFKRDPFALEAVERFIDVLLAHAEKDVYVVSMDQMLDWVKHPVPLDEIEQSDLLKTPTGRKGAMCDLVKLNGAENEIETRGAIMDDNIKH